MGRCHGHIKSVIYIRFGEGNMIFCDCEDALDRRNGCQWLAAIMFVKNRLLLLSDDVQEGFEFFGVGT